VRDWLGAGLALGIFAITRPNILLFAPIAFALALGWRGDRFSPRMPRLAPAAAVTLGACLIVLPVTFVNLVKGQDRVLVAWQGGLNFFLGNNEEANGWSATAPRIMRTDWWGGYEDSIRLAEADRGRKLKPSEISDYWMDRAFDWWRKNPVDGLTLTIRKAVYFLSGEEFSNNRNLDLFIRDYAPLILPARFLLYLATPLACVGAFAMIKRRSIASRVVVLYLVIYALSVILFFVTARYRVPIRPLILLMAIEGVFFLAELARRSRARAVVLGAATACFAVLINLNPWVRAYAAPPAQFYQSIATIYRERGDAASALRFQEKTVQADPAYPDGNLNLGTMYLESGNLAGAIRFFERERNLDPQDGRNLVSLAQAYAHAERIEEAERAYSEAEAAGFREPAALYNHGLLLERLGRLEEAESLYQSAVSVDSSFADAWNNLGVLEARAGRLESAMQIWERALQHNPNDPKILDNLGRARTRLSRSSATEQGR
jgi:Flp pilus assembly protein TadD